MVGRYLNIVVCTLGVLILTSGLSYGAIHMYQFSLDGLQEVPPNASPGSGLATVNFDDATLDLSWSISYSGLLATVTAAHFHQAAPGVAGPVVVPIPLPPGGGGSLIGNAATTVAYGAAILAGNGYVNIHTTTFPGGEIRGQVVGEVPEPGTIVLLAMAGLAGLLMFRHKTRK